jgi:hypothetical protein
LDEHGRPIRPRQELGTWSDLDPKFVGVDLSIGARRIAAVFVLPVQLRVREEPGAVAEVELDLGDTQLRVRTGIDGLLESDGLSDRQKARRKRKLERELFFFAVAIVGAQLDARLERPVAGRLREEREGCE